MTSRDFGDLYDPMTDDNFHRLLSLAVPFTTEDFEDCYKSLSLSQYSGLTSDPSKLEEFFQPMPFYTHTGTQPHITEQFNQHYHDSQQQPQLQQQALHDKTLEIDAKLQSSFAPALYYPQTSDGSLVAPYHSSWEQSCSDEHNNKGQQGHNNFSQYQIQTPIGSLPIHYSNPSGGSVPIFPEVPPFQPTLVSPTTTTTQGKPAQKAKAPRKKAAKK